MDKSQIVSDEPSAKKLIYYLENDIKVMVYNAA